jgi:hypothetical protein
MLPLQIFSFLEAMRMKEHGYRFSNLLVIITNRKTYGNGYDSRISEFSTMPLNGQPHRLQNGLYLVLKDQALKKT